MDNPNTSAIAVAYIIFWFLSLPKALEDKTFYLLRTCVVMAYSTVILLIPKQESAAVELAWYLTGLHFLSIIKILIYPDIRFPRRIYK